MICSCTVSGRCSQTSSGPCGLLRRKVAPCSATPRTSIRRQQVEVVARDELRVLDQIRRVDRPRAEAQVRDGRRAGLLRVVDEVRLHEEARRLADDLRRVLVRADRAVRAEPVEDAAPARRPARCRTTGRPRELDAGDVVVDPDGEVALRLLGGELGEDGRGHRGRELLRRETVAAAEHARGEAGPARSAPRRRPRRAARRRRRGPCSGRGRRCTATVAGSAAASASPSNGR